MIQGIQRRRLFPVPACRIHTGRKYRTAPQRFPGSSSVPDGAVSNIGRPFSQHGRSPLFGYGCPQVGQSCPMRLPEPPVAGTSPGQPRCSSGVKWTPSNNIGISQSPAAVKSTPSFCARRRCSAPGSAGRRRRHGRDRKTSIRAVMSGPAGAQHHYQAAHFPGQLGLCRCLSPGTGGGLPAVELLVLHLVSLRCQQPGPPDLGRIASAQRSGDRSQRRWDLQSTADA